MSDTPVLDLLTQMTTDDRAVEPGSADVMRVRLAALVAVGAPPSSYLANLAVADAAGLDIDDLQDVLIAVAPIGRDRSRRRRGGQRGEGVGLAALIAEEDEGGPAADAAQSRLRTRS